MKLLIITNNPERASFRQRIGMYKDAMGDNGIDYQIATLPSGFFARQKLFLQAREFDGVFLHKKGLNPFDAFTLRKYSRKIIFNFDDAVMYSDKNPQRDSRSHFAGFRRSVRLADMVIAGSSYLAGHAEKFNSNVKTLPIGINISDYEFNGTKKDDGKIRLVWIGSKNTLAYLAEISDCLEEIGRRFDNVILRIVCDEFFDLQNMEVEKHLWSNQKRAFELATSDIGLAPLPDNRFTNGKCSFKVQEYACAHLPVVGSPVGTNAQYIHERVTGFKVENSRQWIDRISELIEKSELRKQMGEAGWEKVQDFDLKIIAQQFISLIIECLESD